jgi:hypothetical protein
MNPTQVSLIFFCTQTYISESFRQPLKTFLCFDSIDNGSDFRCIREFGPLGIRGRYASQLLTSTRSRTNSADSQAR